QSQCESPSLLRSFNARHIIRRMAKTRKTTRRPARRHAHGFEAIPLASYTATEARLAQKFDTLVTGATVKDRQIKALQPEIIVAKVRGGSAVIGKRFIDFTQVAGFTWPDALYVPRNEQATSRPKPPDNRLYSHEWTGGNGVATASRDSGGLFAYAAASTTDSSETSDAAVGITYAPTSRLSYVK